MLKNTASQKWVVFAFDRTDNTPKASDAAQITAEISIDGAAGGATNDTNPTELEDGYYVFDLLQAETNGDLLLIMPESSTADIQVIGVPGSVWTTPAASVDWTDGGRLDTILDSILTDTGTTLDTLIKDIPTTAEFEARTIPSADYTVVGDTIARVTLVDTCTTNTDMDGAAASIDAVLTDTNELQTDDYPTTIAAIQTTVDSILEDTDGTHGVAIAAASLDAIWDRTEAITGQSHSYETIMARMYRFWNNKLNITDATGSAALRNEADGANIATQTITDDDTTTIRTALTWV